MSRPDFAELALALLKHTQAEATTRNDGHTGLMGEGDSTGALDDAAHRIALTGDLGSALDHLDTAIQRARKMAWHYTTGEKFFQISKTGILLPAIAGVVPPERPIVWFSLNQKFEPTARKGINRNGQQVTATLEEMHQLAGGLVRFGVEPTKLLHIEALKRKARINAHTWRRLCAAAVDVGADPGLWFGCLDPLPVDGLVVEVMEGAQWVRAQEGGAA